MIIERLLIVITKATVVIVKILVKIWYFNIVFLLILSDKYLSILMHFLVSKVLIWMVVKSFKMKSSKTVCILFILEALTAPIVIEFFPYELVRNEGLGNAQLGCNCAY